MLAPGFRFHPTDEELVRYYLRRKVCGKSFRFDAISSIDIYKVEPWDLPSLSKLKTRDLEWYFFSVLDKKYGNGSKTNRATEKGYWKTTGKDRAIYHKSQIIGMKKTLVYHCGRAPKGQRSNWVMHEYMLTDLELERVGVAQDEFVLCRVFQKSGSGPKNGEQYGAPFVDEEWEEEDKEFELVPKKEATEEVDAYLDGHDLDQILGSDRPLDNTPLPLNVHHSKETAESVNDIRTPLVCVEQQFSETKQFDDTSFFDLPTPYDTGLKLVKREYIGESSKSWNLDEVDYLLDEPIVDNNVQFGTGGGFIETNDLLNLVEVNTSAFDLPEEYLPFFDDNVNHEESHYLDSVILGSEDFVPDQAFLDEKDMNEGAKKGAMPSAQQTGDGNDAASPSKKQDSLKSQSDFQHNFLHQASQMLGTLPAPPAFASDFPSKEASLHLTSLSQSSTSVHVTAGMIQIGSVDMSSHGTSLFTSKNENFNIILSFGFSRGHDDGSANWESSLSLLPVKTLSTLSMGWFYVMFVVVIISMSFKFGSYIGAN